MHETTVQTTTTPPTNPDPTEVAILGSSPVLRAALRDLAAIVASAAPVILLGESGTGKELLARKIHALGARRNRQFIAINCAALPADLVESELFGHAAGAFSGAGAGKRGLLEVVGGGTLLLDEVGELPLALQAKLLRVLEEKSLRRLGETVSRDVDFRLVSATNRNLAKEIDAGRFRRDLYYRINTFSVTLPPLRERAEDIPELARHFAERAADRLGRTQPSLSPEAMDTLSAQPWHGNVRELANVLERAVAVASDATIAPEHLGLAPADGTPTPRRGTLRATLAKVERELIEAALSARAGNVSAAARDLGIARQQLQRLLRRQGHALRA